MKALFFAAIAAVASCLIASPISAQTYPTQLIKIIVPFTAGGLTDIAARICADYLSKKMGQPVIIENRPGAGGNLGADAVAKADPDGYTLLAVSTANIAMNPFLYKHMPFDALNDLVPIASMGEAPQILVVGTQLGVQTLQQLTDRARSEPGKISYASAGIGSTPHLGADQFARLAKIELLHVPYRGMGSAIGDVVAGHVHMMSISAGPVMGFLQERKLLALAAASNRRLPYLPDVPTSAQAALPGYEMTTWFGLFAPKGTPTAVVDALNEAVRGMYSDLTSKNRLDASFLTPMPLNVAAFTQRVRADYKLWEKIIAEADLQRQ